MLDELVGPGDEVFHRVNRQFRIKICTYTEGVRWDNDFTDATDFL